jgi:hypothetical protein
VVVSMGILRSRLPVAAKIALATAGTMAEVPHSSIPPGGSKFRTMWTSIAGASFMRLCWQGNGPPMEGAREAKAKRLQPA